MKKSLLALAVAALAATSIASTANATVVYDKDGTSLGFHGRVQSVFYSGKSQIVSNEEASIKTSARLGVDLRSQITSGVAGFAMAEWEASNGDNIQDGGDAFMSRLMWVGLDFGNFGQVKVGKFEEAIKYSLFATDIFEDYGGLGYSGNDDRREGVVQYQWSGYGVDALLSYAFAKDNSHVDGAYHAGENLDMDYSVSAAVGYTSPRVIFGPIAVRAGVAYGKMADGDTNFLNNGFIAGKDETTGLVEGAVYDKYTQYALGVSWGDLNLGPYVGAQFSQRTFDMKGFTMGTKVDENTNKEVFDFASIKEDGSIDAEVTGIEFAVGYSFANGMLVRTGYQQQQYKVDGHKVKGAYVPVFALWNLNSQFQVWGEARFDAGTDDSKEKGGKNFFVDTNETYNVAENVFSAGLRYNF